MSAVEIPCMVQVWQNDEFYTHFRHRIAPAKVWLYCRLIGRVTSFCYFYFYDECCTRICVSRWHMYPPSRCHSLLGHVINQEMIAGTFLKYTTNMLPSTKRKNPSSSLDRIWIAFSVISAMLGSPAASSPRSRSYFIWLGSKRPVDRNARTTTDKTYTK